MKRKILPYLFLAPYLIFFLLFLGYPIVRGFYISLFDWGIFGPKGFLGLQNYISLLHEEDFWRALKNTLFFTVMYVPLMVLVSLLLAVLLKEELPGIQVFRTIFFLPIVINVAVSAVAVGWILDPQIGILNRILSGLHLPTQSWLSREGWAMFAVVLVAIWSGAGFNIIIFLAGLEGIAAELYEAAKVDGATAWQCLRYITIPLLKPVTLLVTVLSIIGALQVFGEIYMLTGGGPHGSTTVLAYLLYERGFTYFKFGEAASIGVIMTLLIGLLSFIQFKLFRET